MPAPWFIPTYEPSLRTLTWPNGCRAFTYSSEVPDELRGPQHHKFWHHPRILVTPHIAAETHPPTAAPIIRDAIRQCEAGLPIATVHAAVARLGERFLAEVGAGEETDGGART